MSHRLKVTPLVLTFNIVGFAAGYLMRWLGLQWLLPIILVRAYVAVLASRQWLKRASQ